MLGSLSIALIVILCIIKSKSVWEEDFHSIGMSSERRRKITNREKSRLFTIYRPPTATNIDLFFEQTTIVVNKAINKTGTT